MNKRFKAIIAVVLLIVVGYGLSKLLSGEEKEVGWKTAVVERGTVEKNVTATGRIVPIDQVEVGTEVSGTIAKLYTTYNDQVKKGQLLAQIDKSKISALIVQHQASVDAAKNEYQFRKKQFDRTEALYKSGAVGAQEMESAEYQLESARTTLVRAQAQLDQSRVDLRNTSILSPMDGVILNCAVEEGQTVAASLSAPTLFVIARNLDKMKVETDIDEADVGMVKAGQPVKFRVDAHPSKEFQGKLVQVRLNPVNNAGVITYTVVIEADNSDNLLLPGMTANVDIVVDQTVDQLVIPVAAQRYAIKRVNDSIGVAGKELSRDPSRPPKKNPNQQVVWVLNGSTPQAIPITTATSNGNKIAVTSGLTEGALVIVGEESLDSKKKGNEKGNSNPFMPPAPPRRR